MPLRHRYEIGEFPTRFLLRQIESHQSQKRGYHQQEKVIAPVMRELSWSSRRRVEATPRYGYAGGFVGSFSRLLFAVCACFFIFCFRDLSLSFLPLSPIVYLPFFQTAYGSPRLCLRVKLSVHSTAALYVDMTITALRCRLGTSRLVWIPRLSDFACYLGNLQCDTHRQWIIADAQRRA